MTSRIVFLVIAVVSSGCASAGATFRSGVPDTFVDGAPYYAGGRPPAEARIVHLPIRYQAGGSQSAMFDPTGAAGSPVAGLVAEMNAFLATLGATAAAGGDVEGTPPDVHFGCEIDIGGDCTNGPAAPFDWGRPRMRLAVGRPDGAWIAALQQRLTDSGATHALMLTLEVGQYWPRQTNWRGSKAVELGTAFTPGLPWLSSLETPITVLQITGVVVGADGRARRIGAEGLVARRTGIIAAGFGAQALITDDDVDKVRIARRDDLPGAHLVWQEAIRQLVVQLTGAQPRG